jgi:iron(III) transport system ATP-binding protein
MLEIKNISLELNEQLILDDVSFKVEAGEILSIIGPSGCGKSSILKTIAGIYRDVFGVISLIGNNITKKPINERDISLVFQNYSLFPHMTVYENMLVGSTDIDKNAHILTEMGIEHLIDKYPFQMSGGEQQRVAVARALAYGPKILLLDEPFSNVDAITTQSLRETVLRLIKDYGITTVMVTHDLNDVFVMSEKCVVMENGKVVQFDTLKNIYEKPKSEFVRSLFAAPVDYRSKKLGKNVK